VAAPIIARTISAREESLVEVPTGAASVALPKYRGFIVQTLTYPSGTSLRNKITKLTGQYPLGVSPDNAL
jgi:hypothetical protein